MTSHLEVREDGQLWLTLRNERPAEVELQAIEVVLTHTGREFEGEVLPYRKTFPAGEQTALNLSKFVRMNLLTQRAQPGARVELACHLFAFAEDPSHAQAAPATLTVQWQGETFIGA